MFCFALIILLEELFYFNEELQSEPSVKESSTWSWEVINDESQSRPRNPIWHPSLPLDQLALNSNSDTDGKLDPGTTRDFQDTFGDGKETEIASKSDELQARFQTNAPRFSDINPGYPRREVSQNVIYQKPRVRVMIRSYMIPVPITIPITILM